MTTYERFGSPARRHEAAVLVARIDAANQAVEDSKLEVLRRKAVAAEGRARRAALNARGPIPWETFMEEAQAAMDWAQSRWPESIELGALRCRVMDDEVRRHRNRAATGPAKRSGTHAGAITPPGPVSQS